MREEQQQQQSRLRKSCCREQQMASCDICVWRLFLHTSHVEPVPTNPFRISFAHSTFFCVCAAIVVELVFPFMLHSLLRIDYVPLSNGCYLAFILAFNAFAFKK